MITGIGLDITEIKKIESILTKTSKFVTRVLTKKEKEIMETLSGARQLEF